MRDTHITKVVINKPYDKVWKWLSNPLKFPKIYPNWVKTMKSLGKNMYRVHGTHGEIHKMKRIIDKKKGIIDFQISEESSRSRVFPIDNKNTMVIHLGVRWKEMKNPLVWSAYKKDVDRDFKNAKKIIESS